MQRLPLIKNLVELEREAADNGVAKALMLATQLNRRQRRRRMRRHLVQAIVREATPSWAVCLMAELWEEDVSAFIKFVRMDPEMFRELLLRLGPRLNKNDTWYKKALDPSLKLV